MAGPGAGAQWAKQNINRPVLFLSEARRDVVSKAELYKLWSGAWKDGGKD